MPRAGPGLGHRHRSRSRGRALPSNAAAWNWSRETLRSLLPASREPHGRPAQAAGEKAIFSVLRGKGEKQGMVWRDAPRPAEMSDSQFPGEPGAAALRRSCCGAFRTCLTWAFLSGSKLLPKFAVKELQVRNVGPGLYL